MHPPRPVPTRPVRIAIVNDYEIVVAGTAAILEPFSHRVEVIELDAQMPVQSSVDVVLYDSFGQPQGDAVDVKRLLHDSRGRLAVFSWNTDADLVDRAFAAGASAYLSKGLSAEDLVSAIEAVHAGEQVRPAAVVDDAVGRWPGDQHGLSAREAEVLALICQGYSNQEITEQAFIGLNTVKTYIRTLYRKIGVESRTQAVLWGVEHGFRPDRVRRILGSQR